MNTMSDNNAPIIRNALNSIYGITGIKANLLKANDVNKNNCTYNTTTTIGTGTAIDNRTKVEKNMDVASWYPDLAVDNLISDYMKYDIKSLNEYIDNNITNKKGAENKMISKIEVKGKDKNVIIVHFEDGDIQKAVCLPNDMASFDIATGVMICIAKHCCGGSSKLHKLVKTAVNDYYDEMYNKALKEKQEADAKIKAEEKAKKRKEYLANKRKKESEQRIEEIKEAILRATKEQITEYYEEGENE